MSVDGAAGLLDFRLPAPPESTMCAGRSCRSPGLFCPRLPEFWPRPPRSSILFWPRASSRFSGRGRRSPRVFGRGSRIFVSRILRRCWQGREIPGRVVAGAAGVLDVVRPGPRVLDVVWQGPPECLMFSAGAAGVLVAFAPGVLDFVGRGRRSTRLFLAGPPQRLDVVARGRQSPSWFLGHGRRSPRLAFREGRRSPQFVLAGASKVLDAFTQGPPGSSICFGRGRRSH